MLKKLKITETNSTLILESPNQTVSTIINIDVPSTSNSTLHSAPKSFADLLKNLDPSNIDEPNQLPSHLETDLIMYKRQQRLPLSYNILKFWGSQNNALSVVAHTVLATPSTQVSVERLFSALKYIYADQRNRLTPFNLEHILLVKMNGVFDYDNL